MVLIGQCISEICVFPIHNQMYEIVLSYIRSYEIVWFAFELMLPY